MTAKTLSVTMANYNDSAHLETALKAICTQSLPPDEIIVVDDASTDNSVEIIETIAAQYPFVRLIRNATNQGPAISQNKALNMVSSEFLYIASADDLILPGFFEKAIALLKKFPQASIACAESKEINLDTDVEHEHRRRWSAQANYLSPQELADINHYGELSAIGSTDTVFRRSLLPSPIFHSDLERFTDWFLCETLAFKYGCCYIPEVLAVVRTKKGSYSVPTVENEAHYEEICKRVFEKLLSEQYKDIFSLFLYSRCLRVIKISARTPQKISALLFTLPFSWKTIVLLTYLLKEYLSWQFENQSADNQSFYQKCKNNFALFQRQTFWTIKRPLQNTQDAFTTLMHWLQNRFERTYAKSFHEYNRLRIFIRNKLRT